MIPANSYEVVNSHAYRQCHPETCCCSTDYLVIDTSKGAAIPRIRFQGNSAECKLWIVKKQLEWKELQNSKRKLNVLNKIYGEGYFVPVPKDVKDAAIKVKEYMKTKEIFEFEGLCYEK